MVMERLDAAGKHEENQEPVRQFAIKEARRLLRDAGVVDPGPKEKTDQPAKVLPGPEPFIPPHGEILTRALAFETRGVLQILSPDVQIGSLRYWNSNQKKEAIDHTYRDALKRRLRKLPDAPQEWVDFMKSLDRFQRQQIGIALNQVLNERGFRNGSYINLVELETPINEVADRLNSCTHKDRWGKSLHFAVLAFK